MTLAHLLLTTARVVRVDLTKGCVPRHSVCGLIHSMFILLNTLSTRKDVGLTQMPAMVDLGSILTCTMSDTRAADNTCAVDTVVLHHDYRLCTMGSSCLTFLIECAMPEVSLS